MSKLCAFEQTPGSGLCLAKAIEWDLDANGEATNGRCEMHQETRSAAEARAKALEADDDDIGTGGGVPEDYDKVVKALAEQISYKRSIAYEADKIVRKRQASYGPATESAIVIEEVYDRIVPKNPLPGERWVYMLKAMKLVRNSYSPDNEDHLRDDCGYNVIGNMIRKPQ